MDGPGVASPKIKAVDDAFDELLAHRTRRMNAQKKEKEAQTALVELFHRHEIEVYNFDDKSYQLKDIEKIVLVPKEREDED
jgi:hypothetical protein